MTVLFMGGYVPYYTLNDLLSNTKITKFTLADLRLPSYRLSLGTQPEIFKKPRKIPPSCTWINISSLSALSVSRILAAIYPLRFSLPSLLFSVAPRVLICLFILLTIVHFRPLQSSLTGIETE